MKIKIYKYMKNKYKYNIYSTTYMKICSTLYTNININIYVVLCIVLNVWYNTYKYLNICKCIFKIHIYY